MILENIDQLTKSLQASIAPVTVISGVGLLLLSMTNRYGRVIDRTRILLKEITNSSEEEKKHLNEQIQVFFERAKLLQSVIVFASGSIFFVSLAIFCLLAIQFFGANLGSVTVFCFILSLISLIISLILFIKDISVSLHALKMEVDRRV